MTVKRTICWTLAGVIRASERLAWAATKMDRAGLWLDGWVNRTAERRGVDMSDVLEPLYGSLPVVERA